MANPTLAMLRAASGMVFAAASLAVPDHTSACTTTPVLLSYDGPTVLPPGTINTRCDYDNGGCTIDLKGWFYAPSNPAGPVPLMVYEHGNTGGADPGDQCDIAEWFLNRGFAVFVPHRRGTGQSTGYQPSCSTNQCVVDTLKEQSEDVVSAVAFARSYTAGGTLAIDPEHVSVIGHSGGGIVTVFANAADHDLRAVVDISGAAIAWSTEIEDAMVDAVKDAVAPVFLLQPMNDYDLSPTIRLARAAGNAQRVYQSALFPAVMCANTSPPPQQTPCPVNVAHSTFPRTQVKRWGPTAVDFIKRAPKP